MSAGGTWRARLDALVASDERPEWLVKILAAPKPPETDREEISALSGGKDSTAMALAQAYFEPRKRRYAITPTGDELPEMVAHWALCFWQKLGEWYNLWLYHRDRFQRGIDLEAFVTEARGTPYTFRSPQRDNWPADLAGLAAEFEKGRVPTRSPVMMDRRRLVGACRVCTL